MNDKKEFIKPNAQYLVFSLEDIIKTSGIAGDNWSEYPDKEDWND